MASTCGAAVGRASGWREGERTIAGLPNEPCYFSDASGQAIYFTGSHTWGDLCDYNERWPAFDLPAYLDFLQRYNHHFVRLWHGSLGKKPPLYARTGPGEAAPPKNAV